MSFLMAAHSTGDSCLFADGYSFGLLPNLFFAFDLQLNSSASLGL